MPLIEPLSLLTQKDPNAGACWIRSSGFTRTWTRRCRTGHRLLWPVFPMFPGHTVRMTDDKTRSSHTATALLRVEIHAAGHGLSQGIEGGQLQRVSARDQPVDGNLESDRHHRIALANVGIHWDNARIDFQLPALAVRHFELNGQLGRLFVEQVRLVNLQVEAGRLGGLEKEGAGGNELQTLRHQRNLVLDEDGVETGIAFGGEAVMAEGQAAHRELFAVEGIDGEGLFEF